jgi:hypothetical protein
VTSKERAGGTSKVGGGQPAGETDREPAYRREKGSRVKWGGVGRGGVFRVKK